MKHIYYCENGHYTMKEECHNKKTQNIQPSKYSPEDHYGEYRRRAKKEALQAQGSW